MYDAKLGAILFAQLHVIFETYDDTIILPASTPSTSLSTSFSVDILLMHTKRATERMEKGILGMALKTYKIVLKTKQMSSSTTPAFRIKDEKCIFDAFINGTNFTHFQSVFVFFSSRSSGLLTLVHV